MISENFNAKSSQYPFLLGGGEMGRLIREKEWHLTPVGDPAQWPQSLRTTLGLILNSGFPMFLFWGPQLTCFYNDAYRPSLGNEGKHPGILGKPAEESWPEIWSIIKPLIDHVLSGQGSTWSEDQLIPIFRNGKIEDVYWTFSYSPLRDEEDRISGVIVTCTETTAKVQSLIELEETNDQLAFAIEAAELGAWDFNPETNVLIANQRLIDWFGLDNKTAFDLSVPMAAIVDEDRTRVQEAILRSLDIRSGGRYECEYTIINLKTKEQRIVNAKGNARFRRDGTAYRLNGTLQDVTKEVQSRKLIEESEKRFRTMAEGTDLLVSVVSDTGEATYFNSSWSNVTGRSTQDLIKKGWEDLLHPADKENHLKAFRSAYANRTTFSSEFRLKSGNGTYRWILMTSPPRFLKNESFAGFVTSGIDITDRKRVEEALVESERRFRSTVKNAPIGIIILHGDNFIVETVNNNYLSLVDRTDLEMINRAFFEVVPETRKIIEPLLKTVLESGVPYYGTEFPVTLRRHNKEEIAYFNFVYQPLKDEARNYTRIMVVAYEVTEAVRTKHLLLESEKQFRNLVNQSPIPMTVLRGPEYIIEMANPIMYEKIWRRQEQDVIGKKLLDVFPELKNQEYPGILKKVFKDGETFRGNESLALVHGDDGMKRFYLDYEYAPLFEADGLISGIVVTVNDVTEKVEARRKVEESEKRFRNVADSAPVLVWMSGPDGLTNFFNTAWLKFTGQNIVDQTGEGWLNSVHPEDLDHCRKLFYSSIEERTEFYMEFRLRRYDGDYRWVSDKGVPRITDGVFEGYIGACMDIHDQVLYHRKLKDDEERLNIIVEASELGTWELNMKTREIVYSERLVEIMGRKGQLHLTHQELTRGIHPEDLPVRARAFEDAIATGSLHYEGRVIWPDKSIHWIQSKGKLFYDAYGLPEKMIGTTAEITNEKNYQKELQDREEKFRLLADSMPQFVWTANSAGQINYNNQSLCQYSGLSPEQLEGKGWLEIVHPDDRDDHILKWDHALKTGTDFTSEHRFRRHDGNYRWQLSRAVPQKNAVGHIQMWVGSSTDIQEMKELDQQKDYFISMASHELKTPITSIKGYVQMLQAMHKKGTDEFLNKSLRVIDKQVNSLTELISDLLDLSKIKSGSLFFNQTVFQINSLIKDIIEELMPVNPDYSILLTESGEAFVSADRERIGQVMRNFLTNAVKYSPDQHEVYVEIESSGSDVTVSVKDSGIGVSKTEQSKIFDRFYRVEGKNEKTYPGFGIGLFIASEIIRRHQGKIGVTSEPGKGATFFFTLPKAQNE